MVPGATDPSVPLDPNEQQQEIPPGKIAGGRPQRCSSLWQSIPTDMSVGVIPWSGDGIACISSHPVHAQAMSHRDSKKLGNPTLAHEARRTQ